MITVETCANNNADLYEAVFRAHDIPYGRSPELWSTSATPPSYYSNTVVTKQSATVLPKLQSLAAATQGPFGCKDSFCEIDAARLGLKILFEAHWIGRRFAPNENALPSAWRKVKTPVELDQWYDAWLGNSPTDIRIFRSQMLHDDRLTFSMKIGNAEVTAGCLANRSPDCIGLSNVFAKHNEATAYAEAAQCAGAISNGLAVVGYEHGAPLSHAIQAGFQKIGKLRVLIRDM